MTADVAGPSKRTSADASKKVSTGARVANPTLKFESALHREGHRFVIGCDEVGRGAIAGPVAVGLAVIDAGVGRFPRGLRDSKMLSEKRREQLAPLTARWAVHTAVGLCEAWEIDEFGLTRALGVAGRRALNSLGDEFLDDSVILLDGSWDWLNLALDAPRKVKTRIKADRDCASVSAASVVAKVHRDRLMIDADARTPGYQWAGNKGYASRGHFAAIASLGATDLHRHTWLKDPELRDSESREPGSEDPDPEAQTPGQSEQEKSLPAE